MATRRKGGLGKGLDALLPEMHDDGPNGVAGPAATELPVHMLYPNPHQPRARVREEGLDDLAQSIRAQGVIEPLVVRPPSGGRLRNHRRRTPLACRRTRGVGERARGGPRCR